MYIRDGDWRHVRPLTQSCMHFLRCHSNKQNQLRLKASQTSLYFSPPFLWTQLFYFAFPSRERLRQSGCGSAGVLGELHGNPQQTCMPTDRQTERGEREGRMEACGRVWYGWLRCKRKVGRTKLKLKWFKLVIILNNYYLRGGIFCWTETLCFKWARPVDSGVMMCELCWMSTDRQAG